MNEILDPPLVYCMIKVITFVSLNPHCYRQGIIPVHWCLSVKKVKPPSTVLAMRHGLKTRSCFVWLTLVQESA